VAVDPILLRSALYQCLLPDPTITVLLCPPGEDPAVFAGANHVDVVLASTDLHIPYTQVLTLAPPPPGRDGQPDPCGDLAALLDRIHLIAPAGDDTPSVSPQPRQCLTSLAGAPKTRSTTA
jgi:hypothetical protein